jgi:hypothetical protein
MSSRRQKGPPTVVVAGFAADVCHGICYAKVGGGGRETLVRVEFACRPLPLLRGRDVAYYALDALADELRRQGHDRIELRIDDEHLPEDLAERRAVPSPLIVPYVALRCKLNRFAQATVSPARGDARDLTARALAEVSLDVAA